MKNLPGIAVGAAGALAALLLTGCASSPPTRLYALTSPPELAPLPGPAAHLDGAQVALTRVRVPRHLARGPIVTRRGDVELAYSEFHQWGQPLAEDLGEVLLLNLARLLPGTGFLLDRRTMGLDVDYLVQVQVLRLEGALGDAVDLSARWTITRPGVEGRPAAGGGDYRAPLEGADHAAYVAGLSRIAADLGRDIAASLLALPAGEDAADAEAGPGGAGE